MDSMYIQAKDKTIQVIGKVKRKSKEKESGVFVDRKGYLDEDGYVWIYRGEGKPKYNRNSFPYFWLENGKKVFSNPSDFVKEQFHESRIVVRDLNTIILESKGKDIKYNEKAINDMQNASSLYVPTLLDNDDFLKKVVKNAIIEKEIDISRLKYKMLQKYVLSNMKSALDNKTKMSVVYYTEWMEMLGLDFALIIYDNGTDELDPLKEPLIYSSRRDKIMKASELNWS